MRDLLATVTTKRPLLSDGAWGTFLQQRGLQVGDCPEDWNRHHPQEVLAIARSYVDAGADMILTNSFGANPTRLAHFGLENDCLELNRRAAELSRSEAGEAIFVLGSMGPSGALLAMGEISEAELYRGFSLQAEGLALGGADVLLVETMSDPAEAVQAIKAAQKLGLVVACTFSFKRNSVGQYRTMLGASVEEAIDTALTAGAAIIGTNCGDGFDEMIDIVNLIRDFDSQTPILVHANAGIPVYSDGQTVYPETPASMASKAASLVAAGADIIGGCCGTGPEHIRALAKAIKK